MKLRSLTRGSASTCGPDSTLLEAASAVVQAEQGSLLVVTNGDLVGIITERDILGAVAGAADPSAAKVDEWMTRDPDTGSPDLEVVDAAAWTLASGYRHLPVVEAGTIVGIASIKDVL